MKKTLLFFILSLCTCAGAFATIHIIRVSNYQFKPATTNAVVGDTIRWVWKEGVHTTTSLSIPAGATAWSRALDVNHKRFRYIITTKGTYHFQCNIHPTLMMGTINVTASLSAGLSDFEIDAAQTKAAVMQWKTKSDNDIAHFSLQRSTDGNNFKEIARINPVGNNAGSQYHYTDNSVPGDAEYVYYQVEMTDKKGNSQLSEIKMFTQKPQAPKLITSISPNPVTNPGHLMMQFNADKDGKMLVKLYSENGTFVTQTEMTAMKGLNNGHFHLGDLTPGTYYIVCTLGTIQEKHTIIVK